MKKLLFLLALLLVGCTDSNKPPVIDHYILTIDYDNGQPIIKKEYKVGETVTDLGLPEKDGYIFKGFTAHGEPFYTPYTIGEDLTIKAVWEASGVTEIYTLTIHNNNETAPIHVRYQQGESVLSLPEPTFDGHQFMGYTLDGVPFELPYVINSHLTIEAVWKEKPQLFLDYEIDYESWPEGDYVLPVPNRANYHFLGWYDTLDFVGEPITSVTLTDHLYLFAKFELDVSDFDEALTLLETKPLNDHLPLTKTVNGFTASYLTSSNTINPNNGRFTKPYEEQQVTLTATITDGEYTFTKTYTFNALPYPALVEGKIRTSYTRMFMSLSDLYYQSVDIINPSFVTVNGQGYFNNPSYFSDLDTLIMPKARQYGNRVMIVVGPGTNWSGMVDNGRSAFDTMVDNLIDQVKRYGFAGVDIDWETPKGPTESVWYLYLMKHLYGKLKAINPHLLLTSAIAGGTWQPQHYDLANSGPYHDYINMMAYDMVNNGGGYQNALYYRSGVHDPTLNVGRVTVSCSIDESVTIYNNYGIPNHKIIAGVAFYGRNQELRDGKWVHAGYATSWHHLKVSFLEGALIEKYDDIAQVPYAVNSAGTRFVSYDNRRSILAKGAYVKAQGLAGLMNWDQSHDNQFELIKYMSDALK